MRNYILSAILVLTLLFGVGSVVYYNIQNYEYSLNLMEEIPSENVYVTLAPTNQLPPREQLEGVFGMLFNNSKIIQTPSTIQSFSLTLGKMKFENKGSLSRTIEFPRLIACVDLSLIPSGNIYYSSASWTCYSLNKPVFERTALLPLPEQDVIYSNDYNRKNIEINKGETLEYYISLKNIYTSIIGNSSNELKNTKIKIYDVPLKASNPLREFEGYNYYNPDCNTLSNETPLKTIKIV